MKFSFFPTTLSLTTLFFTSLGAAEPPANTRVAAHTATAIPPAPAPSETRPPLPPLPEGVEELAFAEFFKLPVGPLGLELTDRLRALDGKRVRIFGYMVREDLTPCNSCPVLITKGKRRAPAWLEMTVPGRMMLTARPATVSHAHYGLADDLPPQTLFVTVPNRFGELVPYTPGPMLLTGLLSVGSRGGGIL